MSFTKQINCVVIQAYFRECECDFSKFKYLGVGLIDIRMDGILQISLFKTVNACEGLYPGFERRQQ